MADNFDNSRSWFYFWQGKEKRLVFGQRGNFNALIEITDASKGNLSIQLKKLNEEKLIKIKKYFQKSYPKTDYSITKKGRKDFECFFKQLELYNKKK